MNTLQFTVTVTLDGNQAGDVVHTLTANVKAGLLDQALLNVLRQHLANRVDDRDWRIVGATVQEVAA